MTRESDSLALSRARFGTPRRIHAATRFDATRNTMFVRRMWRVRMDCIV